MKSQISYAAFEEGLEKDAIVIPGVLGALRELATVGWYRKIVVQQKDPSSRRTNITATMTAIGNNPLITTAF